MNTDRLIDLLSAHLEPVNQAQLGKTLVLAIGLRSGHAGDRSKGTELYFVVSRK